MRIIVLVKQVPETDSLTMDPDTGTVVRKEDASIVNPLDLYALEAALRLKDADPSVWITALSMGPPQASRALSEAIAMGCDDAALVCGREFAGSDTWATARTLSAAIRRVGSFPEKVDLVFCGEKATDGDTGQVGPEIAGFLDIPVVTYTGAVEIVPETKSVRCERILEESSQRVECRMPAVITFSKALGEPRLPTLAGKKKAAAAIIPTLGIADMDLPASEAGAAGSPTRVVRIGRPRLSRSGVRLDARSEAGLGEAVDYCLKALEERGLLPGQGASDSARVATRDIAADLRAATALDKSAQGTSRRVDPQRPEKAAGSGKRQIWVLAETKRGAVDPVSYELLAWARGLGTEDTIEVTAVLAGAATDARSLGPRGADRIVHADDPRLSGYSPGQTAEFIASLMRRERPDVLLAAATCAGRTALPYLAAIERLGLTADCTELSFDCAEGVLLQTRPAAGGNIMATIKTLGARPQMATVRPHSRKALDPRFARAFAYEAFSGEIHGGAKEVRLISDTPFPGQMDLGSERIVVAGGRGLKKKERFELVKRLASTLGAGVGASREAVDRGWAEYPHQVGLSGRTITPEFYIACGISGAIQHIAGMQTSKFIVSINTDPDAPIFAVSDVAIVADALEFIPALSSALARNAGNERSLA